ncbi:MAG: flotillin-like protein FloA [Planctomycetota bacterium]|jgi:uncharacterized protein YqfA (UPF0365 family)
MLRAVLPVLALTNLQIGIIVGAGVVGLIFVIILINFGFLYLRALFAGAHVSIVDMIGMKIKKVPVTLIVNNRIKAVQGGVNVTSREMQAYYLAGGDVSTVVEATIRARNAKIALGWDTACEMARTRRDLLGAVETSIKPRIIDVPTASSGRNTIDAVAIDGIQLKAKARVTVRMQLERLIGGAMEETIIARVGEGIVSAIGSSQSYKEVLENPDKISKAVLAKGLDAGTAFEIVSIDIADVDVGRNVGAELQINQANADKQVAQAQAEKRAALARAREQEMSAQVVENRAKVVLAEAEVPKAMAEAFRSGNLGIMDYYRMKNIQADTDMRTSLGGGEPGASGKPKA